MMLNTNRRLDIWTYITIIIVLIYTVVLVYPLLSLLINSVINQETGQLTLDYFKQFFAKKYYYGTIFNSLKVTSLVTLLALLFGFPLAYFMATIKIKGKSFIQIGLMIAFMQAPFIGAYSWILLLGRSGAITKFIQDTLGITLPDIYGFTGILLVLTLQLTPLIYLLLTGAIRNIDNSLLEAAESMGITGFKKITKIVLPLLTPTILTGALLVFMRALADFGTPMLIGEGYQTIPVLIYNEFVGEIGGNDAFAAAISVIVVIFALAIFFIQKYVSEKKAFAMSALNPIETKKESGFKNILAHIYVYGFTIIALIPQGYVIYTSFLKTSGMVFVKGYSLNSYIQALDRAADSIKNTFSLAIISIIIVVVLSILIAYVTVRRKSVMTNTLDTFTMLPFIVPGSILGIALLVSFNKAPLLISGTAGIMIIAFVIRRLTYTIRSSVTALYQISPSMEEASISLGASNIKTFFKVTLPLMLPGVMAGAILSWITIIGELSSSVLLYTSKTRTMTIAIYVEVLRGNYGVAAAISTMLTVITVVSLLLLFKVTGRKEIDM